MNKIIPYNHTLSNCDGAFIKPTNEILFVNNNHENFAMNYCQGEYYYLLNNIKYNYPFYDFEEFKSEFNFNGTKEDIDIFSSSSLNKEQLQLFKLWITSNQFDYKTCYSDFLVCILGFEKVENIIKNTISTSNFHPHIRFYNYYLMDWNIICQPKIKYNNHTNTFEISEQNNIFVASYLEREYEEEINEIKSKVLIKDRHHFFK